ncbi:MAG: trypco2 family protein [Nakamurella sp.]
MAENGVPAGAVPLAGAIAALRAELMQAWTDAQNQSLQFRVAPVELTVEAGVTWTGKGTAGIKWWLFDVGGEVSRERAVTQTIKLTLDPVTLDAQGHPSTVFIDAQDEAEVFNRAGSGSLDATDD